MAKLVKIAGISDYSARQISKDKDVSTDVLTKICGALNCNIHEIVDFYPDRSVDAQNINGGDDLIG